jgi:hypothetical protein
MITPKILSSSPSRHFLRFLDKKLKERRFRKGTRKRKRRMMYCGTLANWPKSSLSLLRVPPRTPPHDPILS